MMHDEWAKEDGEAMLLPEELTAVRHRLLIRQKGYLGGWRLLSEDVGDFKHHHGTMQMVIAMIREEGDDPARYEFRIDKSDPAPWHEGEIISGEEAERKKKEQEGGAE